MKEQELEGITEEQMLEALQLQRDKILEEFQKAYLAETNTLPSEIELVHSSTVQGKEIINTFYFRKKQK